MFMDRMIAPINVQGIAKQKIVYKTCQQKLFSWHHELITNIIMFHDFHQCMMEIVISIETYSARAGREVASMVNNEHLKLRYPYI